MINCKTENGEEKYDTKINVNKKDIIDLEYVKLLEQENMKLQSGMADAVDYFERCGLAEHRIRMLEDELLCLRTKLSILEERGVVDPDVYY